MATAIGALNSNSFRPMSTWRILLFTYFIVYFLALIYLKIRDEQHTEKDKWEYTCLQ